MAEVREVTDPDDLAVGAFVDVVARSYAHTSSFPTAVRLAGTLDEPTEGAQAFLLVVELDGQVVGGSFAYYLYETHTSWDAIIAVAPEARGLNLGRQIRNAGFAICRREAERNGGSHQGMFAEVISPQKLNANQFAVEGQEALRRWRLIQLYGYRRVDIDYFGQLALVYAPEDETALTLDSGLLLASAQAFANVSGAQGRQAPLQSRVAGRTELALIA